MKYVPLVWAAIMRKPTRAILTLLSVMIAFTLFGLTIGMNATFAAVQAAAKDNRIYVDPRFASGMTTMPLAVTARGRAHCGCRRGQLPEFHSRLYHRSQEPNLCAGVR